MRKGSHVPHVSRRPRSFCFVRVTHRCGHEEVKAFWIRTPEEEAASVEEARQLAGQMCEQCQKEPA